jgi:hypothetical protein
MTQEWPKSSQTDGISHCQSQTKSFGQQNSCEIFFLPVFSIFQKKLQYNNTCMWSELVVKKFFGRRDVTWKQPEGERSEPEGGFYVTSRVTKNCERTNEAHMQAKYFSSFKLLHFCLQKIQED